MDKKILFPYGTTIFRIPTWPLAEIKRDMRVLKKLGFNMVKIQELWAIDEQRPGEIDFSAFEELIAEAGQIGLKVQMQITMETAPAWFWRKYPDCRLVYNTGELHNDPTQYSLPVDGKPGPCWDHPGAKREGERFIKELVKGLGKYKNIIAWNVWQEVGLWPNFPGKLGFCYCPHTLAKYRKWLEEKYGSLKRLNETWRTGYGQWEEIEPPRYFPYVPSWIDWRSYMNFVYLPEAVQWKVNAFKENDPEKRPVFCHVVSALHIGQSLDWKLVKKVDFFGSSCYPGLGLGSSWDKDAWDKDSPEAEKIISEDSYAKQQMWNHVSLIFDHIRSSCKGKKFWMAELQGGPVVAFLHQGRIPTAKDMRRWLLTALSTGISGLCFWTHREDMCWQEMYGFGLIGSGGEITPRAEEAGKIAKAINNHPSLFVDGKVTPSETAILINGDHYHFMEAAPLLDTSFSHLEAIYGKETASRHLVHTIRGIYKFLWEKGIWVDFIDEQEEDLAKYKVIFLPFPLSMDDNLAGRLKSYLAKGGQIISECCPGKLDKYGLGRKGKLLAEAEELFGVKHKEIFYVRQPGKPLWMFKEWGGESVSSVYLSGMGMLKNHSVLPNLYIETYESTGATPILKYGAETCGVMKDYGKGKSYLIGTLLGHGILTYEDKKTSDFLEALFKGCGVKPSKIGDLLLRKRTLRDKEAWFLINPTEREVTQKIELDDFARVEDLLEGEIVNRRKALSVESFSVRVLIVQK